MKTINKIIILITLIFCTNTFAQNTNTEKCVKKELRKIFKLSKENNINKLAEYFVYRGEDKARKWKDVLNPKNTKELEFIVSYRNKINSILQYQYKVIKYVEEKQNKRNWYVLELEINKKSVIFAFIKIKGKYVIGDIDKLEDIMNNKELISVPVVIKTIRNKQGEKTKEFYIRRSIKDYVINFDESLISRKDFENSYNTKTGLVIVMRLEVEFKKFKENANKNANTFDVSEEYVIIHKIY